MSRALAALQERLEEPRPWDVVGLGEASWDDVWLLGQPPAWGGKAQAHGRIALGGGQVATAMVACQRLGLRASFIGWVGDDEPGRHILASLQDEGVDTHGVQILGGASSHTAAIVVDQRGERTVLFHEDRGLHRLTVDPSEVATARVLHVDGSDLDAAIAAAEAGRRTGCVVTCDLDSATPRTAELLRWVDVCIAGAEFAPSLLGAAGQDPGLALVRLRELGPTIVCLTRGAGGAVAWDGEQQHHVPAFLPTTVVDTTACGDTFRAGFIAALVEGLDLGGCLAFASVAAGLKTRALGRHGCPRRAEVEAQLASGKGR